MTKRRLNGTLIWVGVIALVLLMIHLTLPFWLTKFLNKRLENMEGYKGHIDHVSLQLYRERLIKTPTLKSDCYFNSNQC